MTGRPFWLQRIEAAWKEAPIVWLCGVRRSGKTTLAQQLGEDRVHYVNCDLPVVEDMVRDPQLFYRGCPSRWWSSMRFTSSATPAGCSRWARTCSRN